MAIFKYELKQYKCRVIIWSVAVAVALAIILLLPVFIGLMSNKTLFNNDMMSTSPFWYFNAPALVSKGFNIFYIILAVLIIVVCVWRTFARYKKRDIYC